VRSWKQNTASSKSQTTTRSFDAILENGVEVGGGVFPVQIDPHQGMTWWNAMTEGERDQWLKVSNSAQPVDAYLTFLVAGAYTDAENEAYLWLATRES
jgi:hypothetical protein